MRRKEIALALAKLRDRVKLLSVETTAIASEIALLQAYVDAAASDTKLPATRVAAAPRKTSIQFREDGSGSPSSDRLAAAGAKSSGSGKMSAVPPSSQDPASPATSSPGGVYRYIPKGE